MDVGEVISAQTEMYGEPLGQRFGRVLAAYRISQARLAAALGLSPPMLSQLMSGQRAKISNPAVFGRLVRLEELAAGVTSEQARDTALDEVRHSRPTLHTGQLTASAVPDRADGVRVLAGLAPPEVLRTAAGEVSDPDLAALLLAAAETFRSGTVS